MAHVEQITNTINMLLEGASETSQKPNDLPLSVALDSPNIHHFLVAAQSARPVDAAGNPWSASYVYDSGNLVLNMLYNLMLEATGRLQKCRLYEMSNNKAFRSTVSYLIVRDLVHEKVFAKALETLGVNWGKALPVPKIDTSGMREVRDLERKNLHNQMWTFTNKGETSEIGKIFKGDSPFDDGGTLEVIEGFPEGADVPLFPENPQEFAPGLDSELKKLAQGKKIRKSRIVSTLEDCMLDGQKHASRFDEIQSVKGEFTKVLEKVRVDPVRQLFDLVKDCI